MRIELTTDIFNKSTIAKLQAFREMMQSFSVDLKEADAYALASRVVEQSGIMRDLRSDSSLEGKNRYENLEEFLNAVKEFVETAEDNEQIYLPDFLEKVSLISDMDNEEEGKSNKVTLMTVHSAKGLEFNHCFIVGLEEMLFPSAMFGAASPKEIEEERRLFYVAVTRAKQTVTLSYATSRRKWGNLTTSTPSRFIAEIDTQFIDDSYGASFMKPYRAPTSSISDTQKSRFTNFKPSAKQTTVPKIADFVAVNPQSIAVGQKVAHATFGYGTVSHIQGSYPDSIATIDFQVGGARKLLLKFAKLQIMD